MIDILLVVLSIFVLTLFIFLLRKKLSNSLLEYKLQEQIKLNENQKLVFESMKKQFSGEFENLANKIFDEKTSKLKKQNNESLEQIFKPFKDKLKDFESKVDKSFGQQAKEQFSLKEEIIRIVAINEKMTLKTENLTKALKGDFKQQGNWGEMILEKILEESGLRVDQDYILQATGMGLKNENGKILKPDVIINLPNGKHIVVDAKMSLTAYERFNSSQDKIKQAIAIKDLIQSVKQHVTDLAKKGYQDIDKLGTPDFVLMFIPIEGAYSLAIQSQPELHSWAWKNRIVMVCPSTFFATLRTISSIWNLERQNANSKEIAQAGIKLYDKVAGFVEDMDKLGKQLNTAGSSYNIAMNKLINGRGNIVDRLDKMKYLGGLDTSKTLPDKLVKVQPLDIKLTEIN